MRLEGGAGMPLRLIAPPADLRALDTAFPELFQHALVDDWQVRTGASREELGAVWTGIAGSRQVPLPDEDAVTVAVSERAIEVLEAVVFELARARRVPSADLAQRTGIDLPEWRRLHDELAGLVIELEVGSAAPNIAPPGLPVASSRDDVTVEHFRYCGISVAGLRRSGVAFESGDARKVAIDASSFADIACRGVRLISSRFSDVDVAGALDNCAIIDCALDGVTFAGNLSGVRFIGGAYDDVDLRSAVLSDCRFYEVVAGDGLYLPDGHDCFVVPVATIPRAFGPVRPRLGAGTYRALCEWAEAEEADYVSIVPAFWRTEMLTRGAHDDVEVEVEVMDRLYRLRVAAITSAA